MVLLWFWFRFLDKSHHTFHIFNVNIDVKMRCTASHPAEWGGHCEVGCVTTLPMPLCKYDMRHTHTHTAHISCMNNDTFYGLAFTCFLYNLLSVAIIHAKETHTHATTAHRSFRSERMKHNAIKWHQIQAVISMSFTVFFFAFFCYFICFFVHWISCKRPINKLNSLPDVINVCLACPYGRWANGLGNGHCRVASIWWFIESWLVSLCA